MSIDRLRAHYGFTRMPFSKELAPGMLYRSKAHAESAVAALPRSVSSPSMSSTAWGTRWERWKQGWPPSARTTSA